MKTPFRSNLLLVELMANLVIFTLCALVSVTLLVKARVMSAESTDLTAAVYLAQTAAETWKSGGEPVGEQDGYEVRLTPRRGTGAEACDVAIYREGRLIYEIKGVAAP